MAGPIVCSECGARNPADVAWCGQCFASLASGADPADATTSHDAAQAEEPAAALERNSSGSEKAAVWVCSVCETSNPLEEPQCSACGTSIYTSFGADDAEHRDADPRRALLRSIIFPGLGHTYAGQSLLGAAVVGLTLMTLGFGIALVITRVTGFGWPLIALALGIWVAAAFDVLRIAGRVTDGLLLRPRVVTALVGLVMVTVIAAALTAQGSSP